MMKNLIKKSGFTLVELMVVVAIIAILTAIITTNFATSKSRARDAKRISDIAQLQLTLELVFDRCNKYPPMQAPPSPPLSLTAVICQKNGVNYSLSSFISVIPTGNGTSYLYLSTDYDYLLKAVLENSGNSVLTDDLDGAPGFGTFGNYCDDPRYCVQPK